MKKIYFLFMLLVAITGAAFSQCRSYIRVDGNLVLADNSENGQQFPFWLASGQTLAADQSVYSVSVLEFDSTNASLVFSRVVKVTSQQTVPAGTVWKVESVINQPLITSGSTSSITFSSPGTSTWTVPTCVDYVCIQVWGAGGASGTGNNSDLGGGGGGGGYGQGCFSVTPGTSYTVTVGVGGSAASSYSSSGSSGGNSSVSGLISATGGGGGSGNGGFTGGTGGTSTASTNVSGQNGQNGGLGGAGSTQGFGGGGGNGGAGGSSASGGSGVQGTAPGGGGMGIYSITSSNAGGGANGQVIITW